MQSNTHTCHNAQHVKLKLNLDHMKVGFSQARAKLEV